MDSKEAGRLGLNKYENNPSVAIPVVPPWLFPMPLIDFQIQKEINETEKIIPINIVVQQYINQAYYLQLQIYMDGSKDPESGRTTAAVYIPAFKIKIAIRISDHIFIYYRINSNYISTTMD